MTKKLNKMKERGKIGVLSPPKSPSSEDLQLGKGYENMRVDEDFQLGRMAERADGDKSG